jgi:hypothetical protein
LHNFIENEVNQIYLKGKEAKRQPKGKGLPVVGGQPCILPVKNSPEINPL